MKKIIFPVVLVAGLCSVKTASAQNPAASQQADQWRLREMMQPSEVSSNAAPEFYNGETSDVGPQTLLRMKKRHWLEAFADEQLFYTDNMFLAERGRQDANVLVSTVHVALAPTFNFEDGRLTPRLGYQHQWFSYGLLGGDDVQVATFNPIGVAFKSMDVFDFNVQTVFSDANWHWRNWDFTLGADFRRFLDSGSYDEFYNEIVPRWSVARTFQLCEKTSIVIGYEGDYRFTETQNPVPLNRDNYNDRTDHSLVLVGNWQLCAHASVQPFYRLQYSYYPEVSGGRKDWLNTVGVALNFPITRNIALRTFVSYETLNTDGAFAQSYEKVDIGGGLNLSVRF